MKKLMIITLGIGEGPEYGIARSIREKAPVAEIIFLATAQSQGAAEKIKDVLKTKYDAELPEHDIKIIDNENSLKATYEVTLNAFENAEQKGYTRNDIYLDFTCGTKVMSAGAFLAGFLRGCKHFVYISGKERDPHSGKTLTDYEVILDPAEDLGALRQDRLRQQLLEKGLFNAEQVETVLRLWQTDLPLPRPSRFTIFETAVSVFQSGKGEA